MGVAACINWELESILDACDEGIFVSNGNGVVLWVNKAYERISGIRVEEIAGKHVAEVVERGIISESVTLKVLKMNKRITITQKMKTGKEVFATGNPVYDENGRIAKVVTTVRDVTELNDLQKKLVYSKEISKKFCQELSQLREKNPIPPDIIAASEVMKETIALSRKIATFDSTCLLLGESGVGKEVIAKYIHASSQRSKGPFMKINCGAIPQGLLEAELFGYEAGAFTGASKEGKPGMFEKAHEGTLFLDEIGEMPFNLQVKLLQALQDMFVFRVGSTKPVKVNARIIAATNRNLEEMVQEGRFRKDLYYRLYIIPIEIPPLCERREDITPMIDLFVSQINKKYKKNIQLDTGARKCLLEYHWPGNVRELKNMIERIMVTKGDGIVSVNHLPSMLVAKRSDIPQRVLDKGKLKHAVEELEKIMLQRAITEQKSLPKAAYVLGIDHSTAFRKVKKYNIKVN